MSKTKGRKAGANDPRRATTTESVIAKQPKPAPNGSLDAITVEPKYNKPDRYSIVRNTHRRTGQCSWGILDSHPYEGTNPVIFVGDNLKDTLVECERLNAPPAKIRYTRKGQVGFVTNDEVEDDAQKPLGRSVGRFDGSCV